MGVAWGPAGTLLLMANKLSRFSSLHACTFISVEVNSCLSLWLRRIYVRQRSRTWSVFGCTARSSLHWRTARDHVWNHWDYPTESYHAVIIICLSCRDSLLSYLTCWFHLSGTLKVCETSKMSCPRVQITFSVYDTHPSMRSSVLRLILGAVSWEGLGAWLDSSALCIPRDSYQWRVVKYWRSFMFV